jgi:Anti-sigma factor NepR
MAGKNGSTQFTASLAVEQAPAGGGEPQRQAAGAPEREHHQGEDTSQQPRTMDPQREINDLKPPRGMVDRSLQAQLGRQLRAIFADIASEPVPDRFVRLLEALEAKEKRR